MSLLEELGKVAGAIAAEQGAANLDPDANFLEKAAAAVAGYEATKIAEEKLGDVMDNYQAKQESQAGDDDNNNADDSNDN